MLARKFFTDYNELLTFVEWKFDLFMKKSPFSYEIKLSIIMAFLKKKEFLINSFGEWIYCEGSFNQDEIEEMLELEEEEEFFDCYGRVLTKRELRKIYWKHRQKAGYSYYENDRFELFLRDLPSNFITYIESLLDRKVKTK